MTRSVPHTEPFVSTVPKLLDVVNVPRRILLWLCVSANYHSGETNARRGGRTENNTARDECPNTRNHRDHLPR